MERRSTNDIGYAHHQGDIWSNVGSSHGVGLFGGSTGGRVEPVGDDTSITLVVRGKNAGGLDLDSTFVQIGAASTTPVERVQRYDVTWTVPALSSGAAAETTVAVTGLTTNSALFFTPRLIPNSSVTGVIQSVRCSTANELVITDHNVSVSSLSGSTARGVVLQLRF